MPPESSAAPGPKPPRERLGRRQRLISTRLFNEAYDQGRRFAGRFMILFLRSGPDAALRLGVVTGRKVGGSVIRSRCRRRLREAFRRHRALLIGEFDVVLLARRGLDTAAWDEVTRDLLTLARRAGILRNG